MKWLLYPCFLGLVTLALLSCGDEENLIERRDGVTEPEKPAAEMKKKGTDQDYIGLTEAEAHELAKKRKQPSRVVKLDGQSLFVTMDYRPERVNFEIEKGRVVKVSRG